LTTSTEARVLTSAQSQKTTSIAKESDFNVNRETLLASVDKAIKAASQHHKNSEVGQDDLFGAMPDTDDQAHQPEYVVIEQSNPLAKLQGEKDTLGLYISGHPIQMVEDDIEKMTTCKLSALPRHMGKSVAIAGLLLSVRRVITKSGRRMAILTLEDRTGQVEVTLFSKLYEEMAPYLEKNEVFVVRGKVEEDSFNQSARIVVEAIDHLDHKRAGMAKRLVISAENQAQIEMLANALPPVLKPFCGGNCAVTIECQNEIGKAKLQLGDAWKVTPKNKLIAQLKELCGDEFVVVGY